MARDPYHPRSVSIRSEGGQHHVVDASSGTERVIPYPDLPSAQRAVKGRQATIKGAITRRSNKAKAGEMVRQGQRSKAAAAAGVTWQWLTEGGLSHHEAEAWLGMDD